MQPEIRFQSQPWASFDTVVNSLIAARRANPSALAKYGWSVDYPAVSAEVDAFNAKICESMGWTDYFTGSAETVPFTPARSNSHSQPGKLASVAAGAETLVDWLKSGAEAVPQALADHRAGVCAVCPLNTKGDWTRFFTVPAAAAIRTALISRRDMKLATAHDEQLAICDACLCPLKLKVHLPITRIRAGMPDSVKTQLHPACWILHEP